MQTQIGVYFEITNLYEQMTGLGWRPAAEMHDVYLMLVRELAFAIGGQPLNIESEEVVLGPSFPGCCPSPASC